VGRDFHEEAVMNRRSSTKLIREGNYAAEVPVELVEDETGWSPYLSADDAYRLDDVRQALRSGDIETAAKLARLFRLEPVAMESN
jgi:hypothetical protein